MDTFFILLGLSGLTAGFVKGLSGFGTSLVAIPLLTRLYGYEDIGEIVIMLITVNIFLNVFLMIENKAFKKDSLKGYYVMTMFGAIFTIIGLFFLQNLDGRLVSYIAAVLILSAIIVTSYNLFMKHKITFKPHLWLQAIVGGLSGLGNGIASIDGPPVLFYLSGLNVDQKKFKSTLSTHFLVLGVVGILYSIIQGLFTIPVLVDLSLLLTSCLLGLFLGMWFSRRLNERMFKLIILAILLVLDIQMFFF
jgi:uncharacterized membrane protein YfcA